MTTYYSWVTDSGTFNGLARMTEATATASSEWAFASEALHGWVLRPELLGRLLDGETDFVPVSEQQAAKLASQYGVQLDGPTEYQWDDALAAAR